MAGTRSEAPFAMDFAVRPPTTETPTQAIAKQGGVYNEKGQSWQFPGGKKMRETSLAFTGTNIKGYSADDKSGKDE